MSAEALDETQKAGRRMMDRLGWSHANLELLREYALILESRERERCCRDVCDRCCLGHAVGIEGGAWFHGTDHIGGEVYAPPEPCAANAIRWRGHALEAEEG